MCKDMNGNVVALSCATEHAQALLRAWVAGNWRQLDTELHQVAELPSEASSSLEEDRVDLLKALAVQLKSRTPLSTSDPNDVRLRLCAKLLQTLIGELCGYGRPGSSGERAGGATG
jgi:hypothetical protein